MGDIVYRFESTKARTVDDWGFYRFSVMVTTHQANDINSPVVDEYKNEFGAYTEMFEANTTVPNFDNVTEGEIEITGGFNQGDIIVATIAAQSYELTLEFNQTARGVCVQLAELIRGNPDFTTRWEAPLEPGAIGTVFIMRSSGGPGLTIAPMLVNRAVRSLPQDIEDFIFAVDGIS